MAPEILSGKLPGYRCLGCILFKYQRTSNVIADRRALQREGRYLLLRAGAARVGCVRDALVQREDVRTRTGLFPPVPPCSALLTRTRLRRDGVPISPTEVPHRVISHERPESQLGARLPLCPAKGRVACLSFGDAFCRGGGRGSGAAGQGVLAQTPEAPPNV